MQVPKALLKHANQVRDEQITGALQAAATSARVSAQMSAEIISAMRPRIVRCWISGAYFSQ